MIGNWPYSPNSRRISSDVRARQMQFLRGRCDRCAQHYPMRFAGTIRLEFCSRHCSMSLSKITLELGRCVLTGRASFSEPADSACAIIVRWRLPVNPLHPRIIAANPELDGGEAGGVQSVVLTPAGPRPTGPLVKNVVLAAGNDGWAIGLREWQACDAGRRGRFLRPRPGLHARAI